MPHTADSGGQVACSPDATSRLRAATDLLRRFSDQRLTLSLPPANDAVIVVVTSVNMDGYNNAESYGWDPDEAFGYQIRVTGGTPAPTDTKYF